MLDTSVALPGLTGTDILYWLEASQQMTRAAWMWQVQAWARTRQTTLALNKIMTNPRCRGGWLV
jgi:hypothetical protein